MPGIPGLPIKSYVQIGRESSYASPIAATRRYRVRSLPVVEPDIGVIQPGGFVDAYVPPAPSLGLVLARAELEFDLYYDKHQMLYDLALGTSAYGSNAETYGAGTPNTHTFTHKDFFNSATIEAILGNIPSGKCEQLSGMKLEQLVLAGKTGIGSEQIVTAKASFIGSAHTPNATPTGALTAVGTNLVLMANAALTDGTSDSTNAGILRSFTLTLKNDLRQVFDGAAIAQPIRQGYADVKLQVQMEFTTKSIMDKWLNVTAATGTPGITFSSALSSETLALNLGGAYLIGKPRRTASGMSGPILQDFTWEARGTGLTLVASNADAAGV